MTAIPASWIQDGFVAAHRVIGIPISARNVDAADDGPNATFAIRLSQNKSVLPSLGRIEWEIGLGNVRPGSVKGAYYVLVGMAQTFGGQVRVTARILRTETAVVLDAAKADGPATKDGVSRAISSVVTRLWRSSKWA